MVKEPLPAFFRMVLDFCMVSHAPFYVREDRIPTLPVLNTWFPGERFLYFPIREVLYRHMPDHTLEVQESCPLIVNNKLSESLSLDFTGF